MMFEHFSSFKLVVFLVCVLQTVCPKYADSPITYDILHMPQGFFHRTKPEPENYMKSRLNVPAHISSNFPEKSDTISSPRWSSLRDTNQGPQYETFERPVKKRRLKKGFIPCSLERIKNFFKRLLGLIKTDQKAREASHPPKKESAYGTGVVHDLSLSLPPKSTRPVKNDDTKKPHSETNFKNPDPITNENETTKEQDAPKGSIFDRFGWIWDWSFPRWIFFGRRWIFFRRETDLPDEVGQEEIHGPVTMPSRKSSSHDPSDHKPMNAATGITNEISTPPGKIESDDHGDISAINENPERLKAQKELAELENIPESTTETTFVFFDLIFELLRHRNDPCDMQAVIMPHITEVIHRWAFPSVVKKFAKELVKNYGQSLEDIQKQLIEYTSWYELHNDINRSPPKVDILINTLRSCRDLSQQIHGRNWLGYNPVTILNAVRQHTEELRKRNPALST